MRVRIPLPARLVFREEFMDKYEEVAAEKTVRENDAHFEFRGHLDGPLVDVSVTIDRSRGLFKVRQKGHSRFWALPLEQVAAMVYSRAIKEQMKRSGD